MNYTRIFKAASDLLVIRASAFGSDSSEYKNEMERFDKLVKLISMAKRKSSQKGSMLVCDIIKSSPLGVAGSIYEIYGYNSVVFKIAELECQIALYKSAREYQERRAANRATWDK